MNPLALRPLVSLLHPRAKTRDGATSSHEVVGTAELSRKLLTSEAWSPTLYLRNRRASSDFLKADVLAFDIDEGMSVLEADQRFARFARVIGTTSSHQLPKGNKPACDRFRLILFLSEPCLSAEQYKQTLLDVAQRLAIPMDQQAKDAARWFLPCMEVVSWNLEGEQVAPAFDVKPPRLASPSAPLGAPSVPANKGKLSRATRDFLAQEPSQDGWHTRFFKAAVDLKEQGYSEEEAEQRLTAASPHFELDETDLHQLADVYANRGGALDIRVAWPEMSLNKNTGQSRPVPSSIPNLQYLLTTILGYKFESNSRRQIIYFTEGGGDKKVLDDPTLACIRTRVREHGLIAGEQVLDLITTIAKANGYDPILDPLNELKWDGGGHIANLFETISLPEGVTEEQTKWYALFLRRWIIGVVTKVYRPGSENNVLVFQGEQAAGKSRWLKRLAELWPEGFGEGHVSPDDKDHELRHLDNYIWHVAEFDSTTSRREVGALKDYFTKDTVNVRRPYARLPIIGRSICSFCASVNSHEFLHDATGNRRYLVIPVQALNANHTVNIEQVMAEAKAAMERGERQWFTREEIEQINSLNDHFLSKEEYLEAIEARVKPGARSVTIKQLLEILGHGDLFLTRAIRSNVRTTLERKGIKKRTRSDGATFFEVEIEGAASGPRGGAGLPFVQIVK